MNGYILAGLEAINGNNFEIFRTGEKNLLLDTQIAVNYPHAASHIHGNS